MNTSRCPDKLSRDHLNVLKHLVNKLYKCNTLYIILTSRYCLLVVNQGLSELYIVLQTSRPLYALPKPFKVEGDASKPCTHYKDTLLRVTTPIL